MHSAAADVSRVQANGSPITDKTGSRYTAASPTKADFLPLMNLIESRIILKGLYSGK